MMLKYNCDLHSEQVIPSCRSFLEYQFLCYVSFLVQIKLISAKSSGSGYYAALKLWILLDRLLFK